MIPLGLTAAASATDAAIKKINFGSGTTAVIISNRKMEDIKIVKFLEASGWLIKGVSETNKKWSKRSKKKDFLQCY